MPAAQTRHHVRAHTAAVEAQAVVGEQQAFDVHFVRQRFLQSSQFVSFSLAGQWLGWLHGLWREPMSGQRGDGAHRVGKQLALPIGRSACGALPCLCFCCSLFAGPNSVAQGRQFVQALHLDRLGSGHSRPRSASDTVCP